MNNNSRNLNSKMMFTSKNYSNFSNQYNPMGNFQSNTPINTSGNDLQDAFTENFPIIHKHDFRNNNNTLHNNIHDIINDEHITEIRINIDAKDRDASVYPNPFHFTVTFSGVGGNYIKTRSLVDENDPSKGTTMKSLYVNNTASPTITRNFKNVRYVRIESLLIPKYYNIVNNGVKYGIDNSESTDDDRFFTLEIPELLGNTYGTNTNNSNSLIIYPERIYNTFITGGTNVTIRTYDTNTLGNIERLTFIFKDSWGVPFKMKIIDENGNILPEKLDTNIENSHKLNNVYNKIFQTHISLVIGIVENNINTSTKFDN